ncbi:MAG: NADH-quinone oxidoreductase subunit H [Chitinispirillaceae bacterium]|nr:NADH-quinone oxidoreductase subunit H [Chitinispirillaceae bacterium]
MVATVAQCVLLPVLGIVIGLFFLGLYRKIMARLHWRYGPPLIQPVIDILRLFFQGGMSHGAVFDFGLVLSLAGAMAIILFIPFAQWCPLQGSGGMLVILYLMLLMPLGTALSGGEAANPNASIGISRKLILALGYEVPLLLILLSVMSYYSTISIVDIVRGQQASVWALFSWPLALPGIAYILILPAVLGVRPFDTTTAPQEISSGPLVEYGGKYLAFEHIIHALSLFLGISLFVNLFLGGAANPIVFFVKILVVFVACVCINAVFPRLRIEQAVSYLWKWPTAIAFLGLVVVSLVK